MINKYFFPLVLSVCFHHSISQAQPDQSCHDDHNKRMACALFGAAAGDALGRITEFIPSQKKIYKEYPNGVNWFDDIKPALLSNGQIGYPYTDDTVMMLIVLEEFKKNHQHPDLVVDALALRFADLFDDKKKYTIDPLYNLRAHGLTNIKSCLEVGALIKQGKTWQDRESTSEKIKKETGCGSVMRVWPIGFFYHDNIELAITTADRQSCITHRNPAARAACAAAVAGFATLCNGKSFDEMATAMIAAADKYNEEEQQYKQQAKPITSSLDQNLKLIAQDRMLTSNMLRYALWAAKNNIPSHIVLGNNNDLQANYRSSSGALLGWRADETVAATLYILLHQKNNFFGALSEAINTPGDSDSIASLVGAFSGYINGSMDEILKKGHALELENAFQLINFNT